MTWTSAIADVHHAPATTVVSIEAYILNTLSRFWIYTSCFDINVISHTIVYLLNL